MSLRYRLLFTGQELGACSVAEIYCSLSQELSFDEMAVQRGRRISFLTRRPAEYLERLLFVCPQCHSIATLVSRVGRFWCRSCGYAVRVNGLGFLTRDGGPLYFDDPADWNAWQLSVFRDSFIADRGQREWRLQESDAIILRGYRLRRLRRFARGCLRLFQDRIEVQDRTRGAVTFLLCLIRGANVQNGEKLEFYYEGVLFRVDFPNPRSSAYMWAKAIDLLREHDGAGERKAASL